MAKETLNPETALEMIQTGIAYFIGKDAVKDLSTRTMRATEPYKGHNMVATFDLLENGEVSDKPVYQTLRCGAGKVGNVLSGILSGDVLVWYEAQYQEKKNGSKEEIDLANALSKQLGLDTSVTLPMARKALKVKAEETA